MAILDSRVTYSSWSTADEGTKQNQYRNRHVKSSNNIFTQQNVSSYKILKGYSQSLPLYTYIRPHKTSMKFHQPGKSSHAKVGVKNSSETLISLLIASCVCSPCAAHQGSEPADSGCGDWRVPIPTFTRNYK